MSDYNSTKNKAAKELRDGLILKFMIEASNAIIANAYNRHGTQCVEEESYAFA